MLGFQEGLNFEFRFSFGAPGILEDLYPLLLKQKLAARIRGDQYFKGVDVLLRDLLRKSLREH